MNVTTCIDLSANTYRYFLHLAEKEGVTPELLISSTLEAYVTCETEKQTHE